jgi:phosphatidylinositol 4-kinase type 2
MLHAPSLDRGNNNWLIKFIPANIPAQANKSEHSVDGNHRGEHDQIAIAAIDNGLAFPCKHPDEWRTYPFHWAWLPYAKVPFSNEIQELVLGRLQDNSFVQELQYNLYQQFKIDKSFDLGLFEKQMSVMRGQIINLTTALRDGQTPLQLVQMPTLTVHCNTPVQVKTLSIRHDFSTCTIDGKSSTKKFSQARIEPKFTHNISGKKAVFSCC